MQHLKYDMTGLNLLGNVINYPTTHLWQISCCWDICCNFGTIKYQKHKKKHNLLWLF